MVLLVLVAAGQPLVAEDTWWHLSMGAAYADHGPWLEADPLLHTATGPPAPAAWLADLALYAVEQIAGFQGLRVLHAVLVAVALALGWSALRRSGGRATTASVGTALFAALSAYRLFQLRPHLFSVIAALLLVRWLVQGGERPSWARVAAGAALVGVWANVHGAFLLGPLLLAAAVAALGVAAAIDPDRRPRHRARAVRLAAALALALLASALNPGGLEPHGLYFAAGLDTPDLSIVADEWARFPLFALPVAQVPPSPLTWCVTWALLVATPTAWLASRRFATGDSAPGPDAVDPALLGVAAASLVAMLAAVRLSWMGIFPLLALVQCLRSIRGGDGRLLSVAAWAPAVVALLLLPGFWLAGDWRMISDGIRLDAYAEPYPAEKFHSHAVWFLRDTELTGNLYNDYADGSYLGYWLAPRMRVFVNGSLNVPKQVMADAGTILRAGFHSDATLTELLDRHGVDVFFGTGIPVAILSPRAPFNTTGYLEGVPGWIPIFRNRRSAVWLRDDPDNAENLRRVAAWYERAGVPFDVADGFDVARVLATSPDWAVEHGLIPTHWRRLLAVARGAGPAGRAAREELASIYAALGLYRRAEAVDRRLLAEDPRSIAAARRLLWSLLKQRRTAESLRAADALTAIAAPDDGLSRQLAIAARHHAALPEDDARALVAALPVLTPSQTGPLFAGFLGPEARAHR